MGTEELQWNAGEMGCRASRIPPQLSNPGLYTRLAERGLALPTQGGSGGQSLAGVLATGTHGGDIDLPPIPDAVRAIHFVGPTGEHFWVEPKDRPISKQEIIAEALPYIDPDNIIYDDDWFEALLVSFGAMGVIYSVVLEARPAFHLFERTTVSSWEEVKRSIGHGDAFTRKRADDTAFVTEDGQPARVRYLEIVMAPNKDSAGNRACYVTTREEAQPAQNILDDFPPGDPGILGTLCNWPIQLTIEALIGALPVVISTYVAKETVQSFSTSISTLGAGFSSSAVQFLEESLAVPILTGLLTAELLRLGDQCDSTMQCVSAIANTLNRYGMLDMLRDQNSSVLASGRRPGTKQGPSYWVMDGFDYTNPNCMQVDSLEAFFPADDLPTLVDDLQAVLDAIDASGTVLGYAALRFTGPSRAWMAMQQGPGVDGGAKMTCSLELTIIKDLPANRAAMLAVQRVTLNRGGRLHWGQRNEELLEDNYLSRLPLMYPHLLHWIHVRKKLERFEPTSGSRFATFDNQFIADLLLRWYR